MRRRRRDGGVALVEFAIVLPIIVVLTFGMLEAGFAYRDGNTLARSTQAATRTAARVADGRAADYEALRALDSALSALDSSSIRKVIVFDATGTGGAVPQACLDVVRPNTMTPAGVPGLCNVYSRVQVESDSPTAFDTPLCVGDWDAAYCPSGPSVRQRSGDAPDRIGMFVELSYDKVLKVLPGSLSITRTAVFQLEPCVAGDTTC